MSSYVAVTKRFADTAKTRSTEQKYIFRNGLSQNTRHSINIFCHTFKKQRQVLQKLHEIQNEDLN